MNGRRRSYRASAFSFCAHSTEQKSSRDLGGSNPRYIQSVGQVGLVLTSMVFIDDSVLVAAANLFRRMGATQVFVFGSATKDGLRPDSDVDMAVLGLPPAVYFSAVSKASELLGRPVDLVDLNDRTPLVQYLLRSGDLVRVP